MLHVRLAPVRWHVHLAILALSAFIAEPSFAVAPAASCKAYRQLKECTLDFDGLQVKSFGIPGSSTTAFNVRVEYSGSYKGVLDLSHVNVSETENAFWFDPGIGDTAGSTSYIDGFGGGFDLYNLSFKAPDHNLNPMGASLSGTVELFGAASVSLQAHLWQDQHFEFVGQSGKRTTYTFSLTGPLPFDLETYDYWGPLGLTWNGFAPIGATAAIHLDRVLFSTAVP